MFPVELQEPWISGFAGFPNLMQFLWHNSWLLLQEIINTYSDPQFCLTANCYIGTRSNKTQADIVSSLRCCNKYSDPIKGQPFPSMIVSKYVPLFTYSHLIQKWEWDGWQRGPANWGINFSFHFSAPVDQERSGWTTAAISSDVDGAELAEKLEIMKPTFKGFDI